MKPSRKIAIALVMLNLCFWAYFWTDFAATTRPYQPHPRVMDEDVTLYVFWGKALPWDQQRTEHSIVAAKRIQRPCFVVTRLYEFWISTDPGRWERLYLGVSPGGYQLVIVMLLSFGQWYLIGLLAHRVSSVLVGGPRKTPETLRIRGGDKPARASRMLYSAVFAIVLTFISWAAVNLVPWRWVSLAVGFFSIPGYLLVELALGVDDFEWLVIPANLVFYFVLFFRIPWARYYGRRNPPLV